MIFKSLSPDTHLCHRSVHVPVLKPLRFTLLRFISTVAGRLALPITGPKVISHGRAKLLLSVPPIDRCIELEGPARYSQLNVAKTFSRLLNRTVTAKPLPRAEWAALFETQGTQADRTAPRLEMLDGFNSGWIAFEGTGTEHFRSSRTLEEVFGDLLRQEA